MGRVIVAGSINMDVVATAERHPRIGETVAGQAVMYFPGGKGANQAVASAKLGTPTALIGRLGGDAFGAELRSFLRDQGVDLALVKISERTHSGTAIITIAEADNTIVVIPGANGEVSADDVAHAPLSSGDVAVSQFEIPLPAISAFFHRARAAGATTLLNPAPARTVEPALLDLIDILVLNETELGLLAEIDIGEGDDEAHIIQAAKALQAGRHQTICITLGKRGVLAVTPDETIRVAGRAVQAVDTTGAGDCFVGALSARLASGAALREAINYANAAAAISVQRMGAGPSMPTAAEVDAII